MRRDAIKHGNCLTIGEARGKFKRSMRQAQISPYAVDLVDQANSKSWMMRDLVRHTIHRTVLSAPFS